MFSLLCDSPSRPAGLDSVPLTRSNWCGGTRTYMSAGTGREKAGPARTVRASALWEHTDKEQRKPALHAVGCTRSVTCEPHRGPVANLNRNLVSGPRQPEVRREREAGRGSTRCGNRAVRGEGLLATIAQGDRPSLEDSNLNTNSSKIWKKKPHANKHKRKRKFPFVFSWRPRQRVTPLPRKNAALSTKQQRCGSTSMSKAVA